MLDNFCTYLRVSTDKQGITGLGMEAQREAVRRYVQNRGQIVAEFIEVESGKKHTNRPQLLAALAECRKRRAVLLIARLDRLARNVAFIANLMNSDVEFVAVDMPHANRLTIHILAAVAEHEREMISQRTKAALAAAKARGKKLGNPNYHEALDRARAALGYRPPATAILEMMLEWRRQGDTFREIAERLDEIDNRTPQGAKWYPSSVRAALLRNRPEAYTSLLKEAENRSTPDFSSPNAGRGPEKPGGMFMPSDLKEAQRMLDLFTSVGARSFVVTKTDLQQKLIWGKTYTAPELRDKLPPMVRTAEIRRQHHLPDGTTVMAGENLIVRPSGPETVFVQLDDLSADQLDRVRPAAFLVHATSPGNFQAWIAVEGVPKAQSKEFIRRVRAAVGNIDKSASGATRLASTFNWKEKYLAEPPMVSIVQGIPGRMMTAENLQGMGLLTEPELVKPFAIDINVPHKAPWRVSSADYDRPWPSYQITLSRTRPKRDASGPDRSLADFNWAMIALTGQKSVEDTITKLLEVSLNAQERAARGDEGYARITVENAAAAVARNWGRSRA
jgi:DNA invertase Pin-like site-specific DNA recombinase